MKAGCHWLSDSTGLRQPAAAVKSFTGVDQWMKSSDTDRKLNWPGTPSAPVSFAFHDARNFPLKRTMSTS